jgi:leucyl aminopeptidase
MKIQSLSALALSATLVSARFVEQHEKDQVVINAGGIPDSEQYLIELAPGETRWVTEDEKWELRRVSWYTARHEELVF